MRLAIFLLLFGPALAGAEPLRLIIETDAGGDPDDEQSLVRFLLYANEWQVDGIIANRETARAGENRNRERTGLGIVRQLIRAYGECWTNLVAHDARYPTAEQLLKKTAAGYNGTEEGVDLIIRAVDAPDARPIWYSDWGTDHGAATNNMQRALDRVLRERGEEGYAKFKGKLRVICGDTLLVSHRERAPGWKFWINTWQPPLEGKRWYHRFSGITATAGGFNLVEHVLKDHGPLGALYPTNTTHWQKEGDTPSFLYLVPTGMNDPDEPTWGSWAGRYGPRADFPGLPYYWASQADTWGGSTHRDNTLKRWAAHLQNDFRARLEWCVKPRGSGNHPPRVRLNGLDGDEIIRIKCKPGEWVDLDAMGSADPDGQPLDYEWFIYGEAGTCQGTGELEAENSPRARARAPESEAGKTVHVIVAATDTGEPRLTRYRRAVLEIQLNQP